MKCGSRETTLMCAGSLPASADSCVFGSDCGSYQTGWASCLRVSSTGNAQVGTGCWQRAQNTDKEAAQEPGAPRVPTSNQTSSLQMVMDVKGKNQARVHLQDKCLPLYLYRLHAVGTSRPVQPHSGTSKRSTGQRRTVVQDMWSRLPKHWKRQRRVLTLMSRLQRLRESASPPACFLFFCTTENRRRAACDSNLIESTPKATPSLLLRLFTGCFLFYFGIFFTSCVLASTLQSHFMVSSLFHVGVTSLVIGFQQNYTVQPRNSCLWPFSCS